MCTATYSLKLINIYVNCENLKKEKKDFTDGAIIKINSTVVAPISLGIFRHIFFFVLDKILEFVIQEITTS